MLFGRSYEGSIKYARSFIRNNSGDDSASTREEMKGTHRSVSFMKIEAVYSFESPVIIIIRQAAVLIYERVVKLS